ncbi:helix-turn-helix domain-containing protein [Streptomyces sp. CA-253872]|uniref:helix-turn-helix domain-containing protein n=1 Tax=Streptomyces sp. CA-253872 TaxID=3240067 RepID=UPI003D92E28F
MRNERLAAALVEKGLRQQDLAEAARVDPKTVERWVSLGRIPHRKTAARAAEALGADPFALWPGLGQPRSGRAVSAELLALWECRADVPVSMYAELFAQARERIDILVYAGLFLHESFPRLNELLAERAENGCTVRMLLGQADHPRVRDRGAEERFGHGIESRCRLALLHSRPLLAVPNISVRTHGTVLYNSLYRGDDHLLVNSHLWGVNAYAAPVWHLRRHAPGGLFDAYAGSFAEVWRAAAPVSEEQS